MADLPSNSPASPPPRQFQFGFWTLAEVVAGIGLVCALLAELREYSPLVIGPAVFVLNIAWGLARKIGRQSLFIESMVLLAIFLMLLALLDRDMLKAVLTIDGGEKVDWSKLTVVPDRRFAVAWLIFCTIVYVSFIIWRHFPRRDSADRIDLAARMWNFAKDTLKRHCPRLVEVSRGARRRLSRRRLARMSPTAIFSEIYGQRGWGEHESASGAGSTLEFTDKLRRELPELLRRRNVRQLLDAPCGDFHWMRHVPLAIDQYIGGDIVPELVARLQQEHGGPGRRFTRLDLTCDPLPEADALLCRDCLIHLSHADGLLVLENFRRSSIRYLISTTAPQIEINEPIVTGEFRLVNLCLAPFNLPPPLEILDDTGVGCPPRVLGVWSRDQLGTAEK